MGIRLTIAPHLIRCFTIRTIIINDFRESMKITFRHIIQHFISISYIL